MPESRCRTIEPLKRLKQAGGEYGRLGPHYPVPKRHYGQTAAINVHLCYW